MMKQAEKLTEMVFILDRSGSMGGLESDTIGGFNAMIEKQKKEDGKALVTTVLFDHTTEYLHDRIPLDEVAPLTDQDYTVRGSTALLDAVGETVEHIETIRKYIRPEDVPAHTIFVITTDGMENASRKFRYEQVKKLIEAKKECGWEFLFIGANIDAAAEAARIGISRDRAAEYVSDETGTGTVFRAMTAAVTNLRRSGAVKSSWSAEINADRKQRKR